MLLVMTNDFNSHLFIFFVSTLIFHASFGQNLIWNLPLDEFGAVDFDFVQNMTIM